MDNSQTPTSALDFLKAEQAILAPLERLTQQTTQPDSASTAAVEGIWTPFDVQLKNRWIQSISSSGVVTTRDGVSSTPNFALGDSTIKGTYLKIGQLVRVKIVFTHGTTPLYAGNGTALVSGSPQAYGEFGESSIVLPFPPPSSGHQGYGLGIDTQTVTTIDGSSKLTSNPFFSDGEGIIFGSDLSAAGGFSGRSAYHGRLPIGIDYGFPWSSNKPVYYSGSPGFGYAQAGDKYILFLKYNAAA